MPDVAIGAEDRGPFEDPGLQLGIVGLDLGDGERNRGGRLAKSKYLFYFSMYQFETYFLRQSLGNSETVIQQSVFHIC